MSVRAGRVRDFLAAWPTCLRVPPQESPRRSSRATSSKPSYRATTVAGPSRSPAADLPTRATEGVMEGAVPFLDSRLAGDQDVAVCADEGLVVTCHRPGPGGLGMPR